MQGSEAIEDKGAVKDKLLALIEHGDATDILSAEYIESLNELMKYEFVEIQNEKLQLTQKGRQARIQGVSLMMKEQVLEKEEVSLNDFPQDVFKRSGSNRPFLVILFFFLISLTAMVIWMSMDHN